MLWHGQGRMRKDWGGMGECYFEEMGGWGCRLTLGSGSQSQTAGLGVGLLSNWYVSQCQKTPTSSQKTKLFPLPGTLSPSFHNILISAPHSPFGITPGPLWISLSSSLHLCTAIASRRGLAFPIDDLPNIISLQSPILSHVILIFNFYC